MIVVSIIEASFFLVLYELDYKGCVDLFAFTCVLCFVFCVYELFRCALCAGVSEFQVILCFVTVIETDPIFCDIGTYR